MSQFAFLADLCESHLIPSQTSLKQWDRKKLAELAFLYFLGLRMLLDDEHSKHWAQSYCKKAGEPNDFTQWRSTGNDLYAMLYALNDSDKAAINPSLIRRWLRHVATHDASDDTRRLFLRLDTMLHINDAAMRNLRRIVTHWENADPRERNDVLTKVIQMVHARAPSNSEILPHLKKLAHEEVEESASAGATSAGSVATVVGGLGAGFSNDYSKSIYGSKKPAVIRR
jgi:hypothetical protein